MMLIDESNIIPHGDPIEQFHIFFGFFGDESESKEKRN